MSRSRPSATERGHGAAPRTESKSVRLTLDLVRSTPSHMLHLPARERKSLRVSRAAGLWGIHRHDDSGIGTVSTQTCGGVALLLNLKALRLITEAVHQHAPTHARIHTPTRRGSGRQYATARGGGRRPCCTCTCCYSRRQLSHCAPQIKPPAAALPTLPWPYHGLCHGPDLCRPL